jgi:hypothetical protein
MPAAPSAFISALSYPLFFFPFFFSFYFPSGFPVSLSPLFSASPSLSVQKYPRTTAQVIYVMEIGLMLWRCLWLGLGPSRLVLPLKPLKSQNSADRAHHICLDCPLRASLEGRLAIAMRHALFLLQHVVRASLHDLQWEACTHCWRRGPPVALALCSPLLYLLCSGSATCAVRRAPGTLIEGKVMCPELSLPPSSFYHPPAYRCMIPRLTSPVDP